MKVELGKFYLATLYQPHLWVGENMMSYFKMATVQNKAISVFCSFENKYLIKRQCRCRTQYGKVPPSNNTTRRGLKEFEEIVMLLL
jgi:hypothetical protein